MPPPAPSVTSIPNYWGQNSYYSHYGRGYYRGRGNAYGYGGYGYAVPSYIPMDTGAYGYDYVGGPPLYSGPPAGSDAVLHIVVEQPPARAYSDPDESQAYAAPPRPLQQEQPASARDAKPGEPSVLVFRDGHQQEVTNYAIMGQTVYVFDKRTRKIALADLDVPATVKANDDRGMNFYIPVQGPESRKALELQPRSAPDQPTKSAPNVASVIP